MAGNDDLVVKIKADIRALQKGLRQAAKEADIAGKQMEQAVGPRVNNVMSSLAKGASAAAGAFITFKAASSGFNFIVDTAKNFEKLNAQLLTVEGSAGRAELAFDRIQSFATTTPYQLDEVVDAFIRLRSRGLDPSSDALQAYGNIAASMGKSLNQAIEAVADASTGEFERLKEFGIKASKQGDTIRFTFQGITTEVANSATDIEGYLQSIGNVNFAGAMQRQMDTLGGATSNLEDAIAKLALKIDAETGLTGALKEAIKWSTNWVNELSGASRPIADIESDIARLTTKLNGLSRGRKASRGGTSATIVQNEIKGLKEELMAARLGSSELAEIDRGVAMLNQQIAAQKQAVAEAAGGGNKRQRGGSNANARQREVQELNALNEELARAMERRQQLLASAEEAPAASDGGGGGSAGGGVVQKAQERAEKELDVQRAKNEALIQQTREFVATEAELEQMRFEAKLAALEAISAAEFGGVAEKNELLQQMEQAHHATMAGIADQAAQMELDRIAKKLDAERSYFAARAERLKMLETMVMDTQARQLEAEQSQFNERLAMLEEFNEAELEAMGGSQEAKEALIQDHEDRVYEIRRRGLESGYDLLAKIEDDKKRQIIDSAAKTLQVASTYSRKAFEVNKAVGIANAVVNTAVGVTRALDHPFPLNLAAAAATAAAGFAQVQAIKNAKFGGGGASGSVAGAANPNNTTQPGNGGGGGQQIAVTLNGSNFSQEQVRDLIDQINSAQADGSKLNR